MGTSSDARRRPVGTIAVVLVGVLTLWAAVVAWDTWTIRSSLETARSQIALTRTAVVEADLAAAGRHVAVARAAVDRADRRVSRPPFRASRVVPLVGRSTRVIGEVTDAADASVAVVEAVLARSDELVTETGELALPLRQEAGGAIDLTGVEELADLFATVPTDDLDREASELRASPSTLVPPPVRDARRDAIELLDEARTTLARASAAVTALPGFLGADGPRRYFLAMQNPAELRGTGGLIGFYAVLTADDGELSMTEPTPYAALSADVAGVAAADVDPPAEFEARYGHVEAATFLGNANVDPHLPLTAEIILDLFEARRGQVLDGVVMLDPVGLAHVMTEIGPVPLDHPDLATAGIPSPVRPVDIPRVTMVDAYEVFGEENEDRKEFLGLFAQVVFDQVLTSSWDALAVGRRLGAAATDEHLQLYSRDADEQAAFERLGVAGVVPRAAEDAEADDAPSDVLGVSANNAAGNKQDVHVAHRLALDVALRTGPDGRAERDASLTVEVDNPLPTSGRHQWIIGSHPPKVLQLDPDRRWSGPPGLNRTWFTVWAPSTTELVGARDDAGDQLLMSWGRLHGHHGFDHFLETPSQTSASFTADLSGPVQLFRDGSDLVYEATLWHQSKAIPDHWDVRIAAPAGWTVTSVDVSGGGSGFGMGVGGTRVPIESRVVDGATAAEVRGSATNDVQVRVRFARSAWDRFRDWLGQPVR